MIASDSQSKGVTLVYDGECPFCSNYVGLTRLRSSVGPVRLVDARSGADEAQWLKDQGYDLNAGIAMIEGDSVHFGADCLTRMAVLSTPSTAFNWLNARIFRSPRLSRVLYPVLRTGRNVTLSLLGRCQI